MLLVNPIDMVKAVKYAVKEVDECQDDIDIFMVDYHGQNIPISVEILENANLSMSAVASNSLVKNSLIERKRLREELAKAQEEVRRLKGESSTPSAGAM